MSARWLPLLLALLMLVPLGLPRPAAAANVLVQVNQLVLDKWPEVAVYLTITDGKGIPLPDLEQNRGRIQVTHNGRSLPDFTIDKIDQAQDGLAVVVAIDTSGSMAGQGLAGAQAATRQFLSSMGQKDRGALFSFADQVKLVQDFTDDRGALEQGLNSLAARGDTALYDAIFQSAEAVGRQPLGRRLVIVITDGEDTRSVVSLDDAIARVRQANTPVYAIGFGEVKPEPLQRLVSVTGGSYLEAPDGSRLSEGIGRISEAMRRQYVIRYQAPDSQPQDNEVRVVLNLNGELGGDGKRFSAPPLPSLGISLEGLSSGSSLNGTVTLKPTITNAGRVDSVDYLLDGQPLGSVNQPPYSFQWDTTKAGPGEHELVARVTLASRQAEQRLRLTIAAPPPASSPLPSAVAALPAPSTAPLAAQAPAAAAATAIPTQTTAPTTEATPATDRSLVDRVLGNRFLIPIVLLLVIAGLAAVVLLNRRGSEESTIAPGASPPLPPTYGQQAFPAVNQAAPTIAAPGGLGALPDWQPNADQPTLLSGAPAPPPPTVIEPAPTSYPTTPRRHAAGWHC
jgi:VWFA-related protein